MKVHELSASLQASEMQNNHLELQLQSVSMSEQQLRNERDSLQFVLAESEQDKLLMETKLKGIANFESGVVGDSHDVLLENIRGKLLNMANQNIAELSEALRSQERKDDVKKSYEQKLSKLADKNKSLRSEMRQMSNQLAQRTVLYAAQERRFLDTSRANNAMHTEKTQETTSLRARLQQLEHQFEITDRARVEAIIECRNQREAQEVLTAQVDDMKERHQHLEVEISGLTAQNVSLHETVSHLRGADYDEIERGIATELQTLRVDADAKEEHLKQQLDQARSILEKEAEHRESLVEEVVRLRNELGEKVVLLQKAEDRIRLGSFHTTQSQNTNRQYNRQMLSHQRRTQQSPLPSPESINSAYVEMFDDEEEIKSDADDTQFYDSNHINMLYGSNLANSVLHVLQGLIQEFFGEDNNMDMNETMLLEIIKDGSAWHSLNRDSDEGDHNQTRIALQDRMKQMVHDAYSCVFVEESDDPWSYISHSFFSILGTIAERLELLKNREKASFMSESMLGSRPLSESGSTKLSKNFLIGNNSDDPADDSVETSAVDALQEELTALKEELIVRRKRERQLRASLKDQGSKLALVLQRAASLPMPTNSDTKKTRSSHITISDDERETLKKQLEQKDLAMACLVSEKDVMSEQMEGYREEIKWLQDAVERSQQIIDNDGGSGYYEGKIQRLQQELDSMKKDGQVDGDTEEQQESVVAKLRDEFIENNKRLHLQAELVKLQDEVSDKDLLVESLNMMCEEYRSQFNQIEIQWESRFARFEEELIERHTLESSQMQSELKEKYDEALEVEQESMQRQVQQLLASMKQQYEEDRAEESEQDSSTDIVVTVEKQSIGSQTQPDDDGSDQNSVLREQVLHEALEIQKLSLEQQHQLDLAEKIKSLHGKFEEQLVNTLTKYKTKYENRLKTQKENFDVERRSWNIMEKDLPDFDETPIKHLSKRGSDSNLSESLDNTVDVMKALRYDNPEKEESRDDVRGLNESNNEISFGSDSSVWKSARGSYDSSTMSMSQSTDMYESPGASRMTDQSITRSPEAWNGGVSITDGSKLEHTPPLNSSNTHNNNTQKTSRTRTKNTPTSVGPTRRKLKESSVIGVSNTKRSAPGSGSLRKSFDKALDELNRLSHAAVHSQTRKDKLPKMHTSRSTVRKFPQVKSAHQ